MMNLKYLIIPLGVFLLSGCCTSNYSSKMKKVLEPTQNRLVEFYTQSKHFPNTKERNEILRESGCEIKGNTCLINGTSFNISDSNLGGGEYIIGLKKEKKYVAIQEYIVMGKK